MRGWSTTRRVRPSSVTRPSGSTSIREMLKAGHSVNEVAAEVGYSKKVIYREKRKL